jgi:hypothetical protein
MIEGMFRMPSFSEYSLRHLLSCPLKEAIISPKKSRAGLFMPCAPPSSKKEGSQEMPRERREERECDGIITNPFQGHFDLPIPLSFTIRNDHNVEGIAKAMAIAEELAQDPRWANRLDPAESGLLQPAPHHGGLAESP